ncbi:MAG: STAS/SEC14 domain-containing protein [Flavobacteriales bacterium]|nr:STAS/SEC14 domain-containing protein [Flavobacteriales bacterium]
MTLEPREHHTEIATLIIVSPDLVEIHYHPGTVFNAQAVGEVQEKRRSLMGNRPYATLTIIPEDVDYNMDAMSKDQGHADRTQSQLLATAVVAKASMIQMLTKLYFSYFPQLHRIYVTDDEQAARAWLAKQMKEIALTGS